MDNKPKRKKRKATEKRQRDEKGLFLPGNTIASKWTEKKAIDLAKELIAWMQEGQSNYWIKDFLLEKDIYSDVIRYLSEKYPRFSSYIVRAKEIEASRIQKFALQNQMNTGMVQWVLSVHHNMHNVQKTETEVKSSQPLVVHIDERAAKEE